MIIAIPKENNPNETRVSCSPSSIKALIKACFDESYRKTISKLKNPYGDRNAPLKISKFLDNLDLNDKKWLLKRNWYE